MSGYRGRLNVNVSHFLADLNTVPSSDEQPVDNFNPDDLSLFTNTFFDFVDMGEPLAGDFSPNDSFNGATQKTESKQETLQKQHFEAHNTIDSFLGMQYLLLLSSSFCLLSPSLCFHLIDSIDFFKLGLLSMRTLLIPSHMHVLTRMLALPMSLLRDRGDPGWGKGYPSGSGGRVLFVITTLREYFKPYQYFFISSNLMFVSSRL